jgi:hypothetical protein
LVTQAVDHSVRTVLTGNVHPLARAEFDQGEAPLDMPLHRMLLVLKRSDQQETALQRFIENQQNKKSASYHKWLTPEEFGAQFGPADSDVAAVTNWLLACGFQVTQVTKGRTVIEFNGTAGQVKQAFGTAIHKYVVQGEQHWANATNLSIPTALVPVVVGVNSLHNFLKKAQNVRVGTYSEKTKQLTSPAPDFTFLDGCVIDNTNNCYAVAPYDFATIYDLLPLWNAVPAINGTGVTIAIVGRTDIDPNDATTFWSMFGLDGVNAPQPTLKITTNGPDPGFTGDESEADIDTQWSGAAAPGATINFVTSESTETTDGVDLSALYIVDNNLAPVMSESYGNCELGLGNAGIQFFGLLWEQAAAQGITAMVSTGDNGSAGCDDPGAPAQNGLNVNGIASTPFNVAVGGTDFAQFTTPPSTYWNSTNAPITQESAKGPIPETTWNDSCANPLFQHVTGGSTNAETNCNNSNFSGFLDSIGGSGGASGTWLKPSWQTGTGVPNDNARNLPDVSLFASNGFLGSFYVICQADQTGVCDLNNFLGFGGTSVSSPAFAGIMALVNQKFGPQGNANLVLYNLVSKQPTAFHDIPSGSTIAMPCFKGTPNCTTSNSTHAFGILSGYGTTTAYDQATGLGSVDANVLVTNWNKVTFTNTATTLTLSVPASTTHGTAIPVTVSVSPSPGSGSSTKTEDVALLVAPVTPGNPGVDFNTLTNGTVTWNTNLLPGGTYKVIAHYAGDTTFGGSYSSPSASITINPENSSVYMPGLVTPTGVSSTVVYGTGGAFSYLLRADVQRLNSPNSPQFCTTRTFGKIACPTGTVTFTDNGNPLDPLDEPFELNSEGYTEDQAIQLTGGSHTLVAKYNGDSSYNPSTTTATVNVTKATTAISNVSAPGFAPPGAGFTVTATVTTTSPGGVAPTPTVSFFANGILLPGTVQYSPSNNTLGASLNTSISTPGNYNLTATYSGDGNYTAVTASNSFSIGIYDLTVPANLTNPPNANPGQSASTTMLVSPVGPAGTTFTNNVVFNVGTQPPNSTVTFSPTQINAGASATTVTITVQTAGPFTGSAGTARPRLRSQKQPLWLPLGLPLTGLLLVGLTGRRLPRRYKIVGLCLALALAGFLVACGGGSSSPPPPVVTVTPSTVSTLYPNLTGAPAQTQKFSASVSNSTSQSVTWAVTGGSANGSVDQTGLYTAPATLPSPSSFTVTATSTAATSPGTATVNLQTPTAAGTWQINVAAVEVNAVHGTKFNLTVN